MLILVEVVERVFWKSNMIMQHQEHQALTMLVDSVASNSPIQAFCVGWNFTFRNPSGGVEVYVPLSQIDTDGGGRTYTFPLTTGWTREFTGISGGLSIRDLVSNKSKYDAIIKAGCTVYAEARIRKYSYFNGTYTPLNTYANTKAEIDSNFSEFSDAFKINTKSDYFDLSYQLEPEPVLPTPVVNMTLPIDGSTVAQGTEVTFKGFGTGVHHIAGYVNGKHIGVQNNPNSDITVQMKYETTVKLDTVGDYTFQIRGRNTAADSEDGSLLAVSAIHTVHVIALPPNSGDVFIKCIDIDTNTEIPDSAQTIPGVALGTAKTIVLPVLSGFAGQGSYHTFSTEIPDKSKMTPDLSQTVTLTSHKQKAYVYFWYKARPVQISRPPAAVINLPVQEYAGNDVNFDGYLSHDPDGYITEYKWGLPGAVEQFTGNSDHGSTWYAAPGIYNVNLTVTDNENNSGYDTRSVQISEPFPQAKIIVSGKIKENRKITLDASQSFTPEHYPIDWSKTTWKLEPVCNLSGTAIAWSDLAEDAAGVRLEDGTVTTIGAVTNQAALLKGQRRLDFQTREAGVYRVTLYIENTAGGKYHSTAVQLITVAGDLPPVAGFTATAANIRDRETGKSQNYGIGRLYCVSVSPDGDTIGKRCWSVVYDADNDGDFDGKYVDTDGIYGLKGLVIPVPEERPITQILKEVFDLQGFISFYNPKDPDTWMHLVVDSDIAPAADLYTYEVGNYGVQLYIEEYIAPGEAIMELIKPGDYKSHIIKSW
ncbi:microbial collagenase precursor [Ruminiclostridium hungatei]|uniref:Microbial collagenase n=2 Tax=Ruminiclostridium hungatei TaxID=48256 RepID=A0A1V4SLX5_RUMHU|nr:microbial collagenase precursor [Ruminiclostridium hungatei]